MRFHHSPEIWARFPTLAAITLPVAGARLDLDVDAPAEPFIAAARTRLGGVASESELPEIQAWRRAFGDMTPTQSVSRSSAEHSTRSVPATSSGAHGPPTPSTARPQAGSRVASTKGAQSSRWKPRRSSRPHNYGQSALLKCSTQVTASPEQSGTTGTGPKLETSAHGSSISSPPLPYD